jgi:hypothetical protein
MDPTKLTDAELTAELESLDSQRQVVREKARVIKSEINRRSTERAVISKLLFGGQLTTMQQSYYDSLEGNDRARVKKAIAERLGDAQQAMAQRVARIK